MEKHHQSTTFEIYDAEVSIKEVKATLDMEGFNLSAEELNLLGDCINGNKNSETVRQELISKIIYRKHNA